METDSNGVVRLSWTLSEDDGYNDRDVVGYEVYRTIQPQGTTELAVTLSPGTTLFEEPAPETEAGQFVSYSLVAIDTNSVSSAPTVSTHPHPDGGTDNDFDGMPDQWEALHDLNASDPTDAGHDADGDGLSNLQEYGLGTNPLLRDTDGDGMGDGDEAQAGTDPLSATDVFKIVAADGEEGYVFAVTWNAKAGRTYRIEATDNLQGEWTPAPDGVLSDERNQRTATEDGPMRYLDATPGPVEKRFYRVKVLP